MSQADSSTDQSRNAQLLQVVREMAARTYAPFTQRLLQDNVPVVYEDLKDPNLIAAYSHNPLRVSVNENAALVLKRYDLATVIEQQAVFHDQYQSPVLKRYNLGPLKPQAGFKFDRVKAMEAYGHQLYKILVDYRNGAIYPHECTEQMLSSDVLAILLRAYTGKPFRTADNKEKADRLKQVAGSGDLKSADEVLSHFYPLIVTAKPFMTQLADQTLAHIELKLAMADVIMGQRGSRAAEERGGISFQQDFTFEDARQILDRNGFQHFSHMNGTARQLFWTNLSFLEKPQRERVNHYKDRAAKLLANGF